jgi:predicted RNase H-like HicB family nuclease
MALSVERKTMKFAAVFEHTETGWSGWAPDLPGLGVAGETFEETEQLMREGIEFHIEGLRADGELVPEPTTRVGEIAVSA